MARYDLTDFEWSVIEPLLPMDRRGPKPQNNRQILNGMFFILRAGSPWRDLPERYGPYTTVYNRFNRWRKAGIWDCLMDAIVKAHDGKVQMIDSSIVRVHQHASGPQKKVEHPRLHSRSWRNPKHSQPIQSQDQIPLEESHLPSAKPRRALLQQAEAVSTHRHPLRQARRQLLRFYPTWQPCEIGSDQLSPHP